MGTPSSYFPNEFPLRLLLLMLLLFVWSFQVRQFGVVSGYRRNMGYLRVDCRAGVFALLDTLLCPYPVGDSSLSLLCGGLFLVPTLWGTLPCPYPVGDPVGDSALFPTLLWDP